MRKSLRIIFVILLFAALGTLAWVTLRKGEPAYDGKPLHVWLEAYDQSLSDPPEDLRLKIVEQETQKQAAALVHIGTDALPTLLRLIQTRNSSVRSNLSRTLDRQSILSTRVRTGAQCQWMAVHGFQALGAIGKPAVPKLIGLLKDPELRWAAGMSLGMIGPESRDAVPLLTPWLTNANRELRFCAADALGRIGSPTAQPALLKQMEVETNQFVRDFLVLALARQRAYPEKIVPWLVKCLQDDVAGRRFTLAHVEAIRLFGAAGKPAVPMLLKLKEFIPLQIDDVLKAIDPEAAAKADVN